MKTVEYMKGLEKAAELINEFIKKRERAGLEPENIIKELKQYLIGFIE